MNKNSLGYFSSIFCINLAHRTDRKALIQNELSKLGLYDVNFFPAIYTPQNRHLGCLLSHRAIILEAKRRNLGNVLIFEDDMEIIDDNLHLLDGSVERLGQKKWDLFYLGCSFFLKDLPYMLGDQYLLEVHGGRSTHAVAYNGSFYDVFLEITSSEQKIEQIIDNFSAFDAYFAKIIQERSRAYMPIEPICKQRKSFSDNELKIIDLDKHILSNFSYLKNQRSINVFFKKSLRKIFYTVWIYTNWDLFKILDNLKRVFKKRIDSIN